MAPSKRIVDKGKAPAISKLPVQKPTRLPPVNYGPFLNALCLMPHQLHTLFSKRLIAIERFVHEKTLFDTLVGYTLIPGGWESLMTIKGARPIGQTVAFPPEELDKAVISEVLGREGTMLFEKLQATECLL